MAADLTDTSSLDPPDTLSPTGRRAIRGA
ncbi:MAG: hypothetical protein QOC75_3295, partial [Pseudonocardiales bacterium]|nr:hypothetical protein [Pseudonocardiales bacterium]